MSEVAALIQAVEQSRAALLSSVAGMSEAQAAFKPVEDHWSIAKVVEHLYLAEISGVSKIWAALDVLEAGHAWDDARPNHGKPIEDVIAATWKPKEVAPPIATPHIGGPIDFWVSATRSLTPVLAELGVLLQDTNLDDVVFPHFLCGPLDARQRLEFLRFHIERHLNQIADIRGTAGFPS